MIELLQESIRTVNLPYTIFFGLAVLYWLLYIAGIFGADLLDFAVDADAAGDAGGDVAGSGGGLSALFHFLHAADVPMSIILTVLSFTMWAISILVNYYTNNTSVLLALVLALPIIGAGLVSTKIAIKPFVPLLKAAFEEKSDAIEVIGQLCVVTSLEVSPRHGQAEVPLKGAPLTLNVKTREGQALHKGDEAVVIGREEDGTYLVAPFEGARIGEDSPAD